MPNHTLARNLTTETEAAAQLLCTFLGHLVAYNIKWTALTIATNGVVTLTVTQTLTAEVRAHLGLS